MPFISLDSGEPFGLPRGTVRGLIALILTGTLVQQTMVGAIDPIVFVGIAGGSIGSYFTSRAAEPPVAAAPVEAPLPKPYTGDDAKPV